MNIFDLKQDLIAIFDELEENGGELTPDIEKALTFTQSEATEQVHHFCDVVKLLKEDISLIDQEAKRLRDLKARKLKVIERITALVCDAIETFGTENKTGNKVIDWGTGKVSTRRTQSFNESDNATDIVKDLFDYFEWLNNNNQLDVVDKVDSNAFAQMLEKNVHYEKDIEPYENPIVANDKELNNLDAKVEFNIPVSEIMNGKGYEVIKRIVQFTKSYSYSPVVNKAAVKNDPTEMANLGSYQTNKSLIIK